MTRRFTETDKWNDEWFLGLPFEAKLLFTYLCDNCDIGGFWEVDYEHASRKTGLPRRGVGLLVGQIMSVEDAMGECCAKMIWREDESVVYLKNFLRHQGNWPVGRDGYSKGIAKRFDAHGVFGRHVFDVLSAETPKETVSDLIYGEDNPLRRTKKGASKELQSSLGIGIGIGIGKKGSAEGKHHCLKRRTIGCTGPGAYAHIDDVGFTYYLCEECEQERRVNGAAKQTV